MSDNEKKLLEILRRFEAALKGGVGIYPTLEEFEKFFNAFQTKLWEQLQSKQQQHAAGKTDQAEPLDLSASVLKSLAPLLRDAESREHYFGLLCMLPISVDPQMEVPLNLLVDNLEMYMNSRKEHGLETGVLTTMDLVSIAVVAICATKVRNEMLSTVKARAKSDPELAQKLGEVLAKEALRKAQSKAKTD